MTSSSSSKDWGTLPFEILLKVFGYVQDARLETDFGMSAQKFSSNMKDLEQCQLACKGWLRAAQKTIYEQIHLGANLQQFAQTITVNNPHLATLVKKVSFGRDINSTDDCSNCVASVVTQCTSINHLLLDGQTTEKLVWPWLLLEDMKLNNLEVITNNLYYTNMELVLYSLLAVKLRKTLKTLKISLVEIPYARPTANESRSYRRIIKRLSTFSTLESLMITDGYPPSYQTLDQTIDDCSQTLSKLTISMLELNEWRKEVVKANQTVKCLEIGSFRIDGASLSYLISKFKGLDSLTIVSLTYKDKEVAEKEEHWNELTQLCTSAKAFDITLQYNQANIKTVVDKCLDILQRVESRQRRLRINIFKGYTYAERSHDFSPPTPDNMLMLAVTIGKSSTGSCSIEISANTEASRNDILKHMVEWIQLYAPTSVAMDDSFARTSYHNLFNISIRNPPKLKPYFDFCSKSDIKQFLTRECSGKYWDVFNTFLSSTSTTMSTYGIVLPNVPSSSSHTGSNQKETTTREITIKDSVICPTTFIELSKSLPSLKVLRLESNCYLTPDPYTLKIFLPATALDQLTLSISTTCGDAINSTHYYYGGHHCALENRELEGAVSSNGQYTLKIEANGKTYITKRQNGEPVGTVDSKPEDVKWGDKDSALIWITCKALKKFRICNGEQSLKEKQYEELD